MGFEDSGAAMRRTFARLTITAAATAGLAATAAVQALGLGEIDVNSNLNQRFTASIPLTEISAEELETVTVTLAPNEAFERAGIERSEYLSTLDFEIKNDRGRPRVVVTSSQIAREPVLDLLVQARWSGGKILRDYTVLLDPVETAAPTRAAAPVPTPVPAPAPARAVPAPSPSTVAAPVVAMPAKPSTPVGSEFYEVPAEAKPARKPAPATAAPLSSDAAFDSATGSYGPVAPKETLWSIATKVRPGAAVSMDQVLLALAEANPVAIQRGTTVSKGAVLRVPSAERIQSVTPAQAKTRLAALRGEAAPVVKVPAAPKAPATVPVPPAAAPATVSAPSAPVVATAAPTSAEKATTRPELPKPQLALPPPSAPAPAPAPASAAIVAAPAPAPAAAPEAAATAAAVSPAGEATSAASAAAPAVADAAATPVAAAAPSEPAAALPTPAVAAPVKSPLAQPLPEEDAPGLFAGLGLPLSVAGLVLLLGGAGFALARRRKAAVKPEFAPFKAGDTSTVMAPAGSAGAVSKLGDTTRISDTLSLPARDLGAAAAMESTLQMTVPPTASFSTQPVAAHDSTLILDPEAVATLNSSVKQSAVTSGAESFDKTTQVQVDTLHINLGDNDPLSEADFHLAYGLYDEAILLLNAATAQQPDRTDLKVKLAETYFAAGRPLEFQELAEELKGKLSAAEWSKLAIMGAQIAPDVALFQAADGEGALDADFDLGFDDVPGAPELTPSSTTTPGSGSIDFALDLPQSSPAPQAAPASQAMTMDERRLSLSADLDLGDDSSSSSQVAMPPAGLDDEASIDFMLGQSLTPLGAGIHLPDAKDLNFNLGSSALNIDIPSLELASPPSHSNSMANMEERPTLVPPTDSLSFSLQDLEVSITPRQNAAESVDDELNTKLDLARAYVEMGDNDMARSLLQEVQQQGGERHQQEAASLLQRLPA